MKKLVLLVLLLCPVAVYSAETAPPQPTQTEETKLYDHYVGMQQTQERLSQRSPEEQKRLQPQIRRAEAQACQRLRQDRQEGTREDEYSRQGGDQFVAFTQQFERYCETLR